MAKLALVRHGQSLWNAQNLWTGWTDVGLSEKGKTETENTARSLVGVHWDYLFESDLLRAKETSSIILNFLNSQDVQRIQSPALRERNYGVYTGKNKLDIQKNFGDEGYKNLRRGWNVEIENGESLKQVYGRVVPYFKSEIEPKLHLGKNVIISAHGNSLRALLKYLKNIPDEDIVNLEVPTGEAQVIDYT